MPMRWLFVGLVLANLLFLGWQYGLRERADPAVQFAALEVRPDRIRLLGVQNPVSQPPDAVAVGVAPAAIEACAEWGPFSGPDMARADAALAALGLPAEALQRRVTEVDGYWVHLPAQKTRAETERKLGQLKALGITGFQVVQEPAGSRSVISLGVFRNEDLAQAELERLRVRGLRTAVMTRREHFFRQVNYVLRETGASSFARIRQLQPEFPATEFRAIACPEAADKNKTN
jgi:hypothetical protein